MTAIHVAETLEFLLAKGEGTSWGAVLRVLLPGWKLDRPGYGTKVQRQLAFALWERASSIDAILADELVATLVAGGRPALYELCVAKREADIADALMKLDASETKFAGELAKLAEQSFFLQKAGAFLAPEDLRAQFRSKEIEAFVFALNEAKLCKK